MLDVFRVQSDGKWYSAKVRLEEVDASTMRVAIKSIHEVKLLSSTSHSVVRQVYTAEDGTTFSQNKFASIFQKLMTEVAHKYKVGNILYSEK